MPKSKIILSLGFLIALLPVIGIPQSWKSFLEVASGLLIVLLSVLISVDRRLTLKAKAEKRALRKRALAQAATAAPLAEEPAGSPMFGRRATDQASQPFSHGRRSSDRRSRVKDAEGEEGSPIADASETPEIAGFNTPEL